MPLSKRKATKKVTFTEEELKDLWEEREDEEFRQYTDRYAKERNFKSVWFMNNKKHKIKSMEDPSPFKLGSIVKLEKCCFVTKAAIGGKATWGDVWSACDAVIRNALMRGYDDLCYIESLTRERGENTLSLFVS